MGKRRRSKTGKKEREKSQAKQESKGKAIQNGHQPKPTSQELDIDEDCVQYQSSSDEEAPTAQPKAKQAKVAPDEDSDDSEDGDDDQSDEELQLAQAEGDESDAEVAIEFFDPREEDVTPVAIFLEKFTYACAGTTKEAAGKGTKKLDTRELAEAICEQTRVGTMIRVTDEETPIGFISCLNVNAHKELLDPLRKHLNKVCGKKKEDEKFGQIVERTFDTKREYESNRMGLILCERVVNLPAQILPKMLEALFCEIEWAVEDEPTEKEREAFRLGWFLYITEVYCAEGEEMAFGRVEDEAWFEYASHKIIWDVTGEVAEGGFRKRRMGMLIAKAKIPKVRERVMQLVRGENEMERNEEEESAKKD